MEGPGHMGKLHAKRAETNCRIGKQKQTRSRLWASYRAWDKGELPVAPARVPPIRAWSLGLTGSCAAQACSWWCLPRSRRSPCWIRRYAAARCCTSSTAHAQVSHLAGISQLPPAASMHCLLAAEWIWHLEDIQRFTSAVVCRASRGARAVLPAGRAARPAHSCQPGELHGQRRPPVPAGQCGQQPTHKLLGCAGGWAGSQAAAAGHPATPPCAECGVPALVARNLQAMTSLPVDRKQLRTSPEGHCSCMKLL